MNALKTRRRRLCAPNAANGLSAGNRSCALLLGNLHAGCVHVRRSGHRIFNPSSRPSSLSILSVCRLERIMPVTLPIKSNAVNQRPASLCAGRTERNDVWPAAALWRQSGQSVRVNPRVHPHSPAFAAQRHGTAPYLMQLRVVVRRRLPDPNRQVQHLSGTDSVRIGNAVYGTDQRLVFIVIHTSPLADGDQRVAGFDGIRDQHQRARR